MKSWWIAMLGLVPAVSAAGDTAGWESALARHPLTKLDGSQLHLKELHGEVVVVSFWASWCKPCKKELRELDGWVRTAGDEAPRIVAVSVDSDTKKAIRFVQDAAVRIPVYHDGSAGLAKTLDLPSLPMTIVLDRDGRIVHVARGGSAEDMATLRRTVNDLLRESAAPRAPAAQEADTEVEG